jgi:hypothetical protein
MGVRTCATAPVELPRASVVRQAPPPPPTGTPRCCVCAVVGILCLLFWRVGFRERAALCSALYEEMTDIVDSGNTAWVLASSALVLLMTPALALCVCSGTQKQLRFPLNPAPHPPFHPTPHRFYGGFMPKHAALSTMLMSWAAFAVISILWSLLTYSLAFGPGGAFGQPPRAARTQNPQP